MVAKLKYFRSLINLEKVFLIKDLLPEFLALAEKAQSAKDKINSMLRDYKLGEERHLD